MLSRVLRLSSGTIHRRAPLHTTPIAFTAATSSGRATPRPQPTSDAEDTTHTPDSYSKDVDVTPPPDPTTHRVDAASEAVQRPHEPPSGEYSRAGTKTKEFEKGKDHA
jgi:hypothetical protein